MPLAPPTCLLHPTVLLPQSMEATFHYANLYFFYPVFPQGKWHTQQRCPALSSLCVVSDKPERATEVSKQQGFCQFCKKKGSWLRKMR